MKAELIDVSACKKNLDIEIPQEVVDQEITHIAQEFARKAKVPGFRPGKAPIGVVKTRYRDEIVSEMMQHLMPKYVDNAIEERKLDVVLPPRFESIDYSQGKALRFKAVLEVYPNLNITNYEGIPAQEVSVKVEDSEVESKLKKLQEDMAELVPVEEERPLKDGDCVDISFDGTVQGSGQPEVVGQKAVAEIGGRTTIKEFSENLVGLKVGDEKTFNVEYRPDYPDPKLAGKTIEYKVTVDAIKRKEEPDLNEEFAQRLGDYKTIDDVRENIRKNLEKRKQDNAQEELRDKLLEWLENNNDFEVPESLVERQLQIRGQRLLRDLSRQGIHPERLDVDWGKIREDQHKQALRDVKGSLILDHISEKENITVTDTEIDAEIDKIAAETDRPKEKVREVLSRDSGLERLRGQIRNTKTLDLLEEKARIMRAE